MALKLQIILIVFVLLSLLYIFRRVSQKRLDYRFGLVWSLVCIVVAVFAAWPRLLALTSHLLGIYDPVNMLSLLGIILIIMIVFSLFMEISKQSEQIKQLTQELAILRKDTYDQINQKNNDYNK